MEFVSDHYDRIMDQVLERQEKRREKTNYRYAPKRILRWGPYGRHSIWIEYEDGIIEEYNSLDGYCRDVTGKLFKPDEESEEHDFSRRLYEKMRDKGFDQDMLAKESGVSQSMISNYLNGKSSPRLDKLEKIARALECPVIELINNY